MILLMARKNSTPIAGLIVFFFNKRASAEFLAYDGAFLEYGPNHLLYWEAIRLAHEKGYGIFDFGRTSSLNMGLMSFKSKWGTKVVDLPTFYFPPEIAERKNREELSLKYSAVRYVCRYLPDTIQRLLGNILYRHMG
jgi:lipid II:glycine glycyltransferase (peptidoglycan interpeptide bridge formation enzyme)